MVSRKAILPRLMRSGQCSFLKCLHGQTDKGERADLSIAGARTEGAETATATLRGWNLASDCSRASGLAGE